MMRRIPTILLAFTIIGLCSMLPAHAIVYSLQRGYSARNIKDIIKARKVLKDKVTVNGVKGDLVVSITDKTMAEISQELKSVLVNYDAKASRRSILIDIPNREMTTRLYILNTGAQKTVVFELKIPKDGLKEGAEASWPDDLPKPFGVRVDQVMVLKRSEAVYAQFSSDSSSAEGIYNSYSSSLTANGWRAVSKDGRSGGVFMDAKSSWMLVFSTCEDDARAYGSVYLRQVQ